MNEATPVAEQVAAVYEAITASDLTLNRIPDNQLLKRNLHDVELIDVETKSGSPSCIPEGDFPQPAQFTHEIRRLMSREDVDLVVPVVRVAKESTFIQF